MRIFSKDEKLGEEAVNAITNWLDIRKISWRPATESEQHEGIDIWVKDIPHEIKHQSIKDCICIEESNLDGKGSGWIYTTKAKFIIEVSADRKTATKLDIASLKNMYEKTKKHYRLNLNDKTDGKRGDKWQGSFRVYPLSNLQSYIDVKTFKL